MFSQWLPLIRHADVIAIMLWEGDGSDLLEYRGLLEDEFEWGRYLGKANDWKLADADQTDVAGAFNAKRDDPHGVGLHSKAYLYRPNPPRFTYGWLKNLTAAIRRIGFEITGKKIVVGTTFDSTGEFNFAHFKYEGSFVGCAAVLKGDALRYAAFPNGIPDGTPFGTFLGRQLKHYNEDIGFDFVWFSNGFGFGVETWGLNGVVFDGKDFSPEKVDATAEGIRGFWRAFRAEVPNLPVRTRGTNVTTGVDLGSDAVPVAEIYDKFGPIEPPVNSPWAALDGDFGLEFAGWMSHMAHCTSESYPFRFYIHDPWWMNSPWFDRYERQAHDIYMPLLVSRITEEGVAEPADYLNFLTADNSLGEMPDELPPEVTGHLLRARELAPDQPGPIVWVYPFAEYHEKVLGAEKHLDEIYFGDWYVRGVINQGLPVNTVVTTTNYLSALEKQPRLFAGMVLFTPVPDANSAVRKAILEHVRAGGQAMLYGPVREDDTELRALLGLKQSAPLEGDFDLALAMENHGCVCGTALPIQMHHASVFSGGALVDVFEVGNRRTELAAAHRGNERRALAVAVNLGSGTLIWLRGGVTCNENKVRGPLPAPLDPAKFFQTEALARIAAASQLGIDLGHQREEISDRVPLATIARSRNAFVFAGYNPQAAQIDLRMPLGAPLFVSHLVHVENSHTVFTPQVGWLGECRLFIEQSERSRIYVREACSVMTGVRRRLQITGLKNAVVRFFPDLQYESELRFLVNGRHPYQVGNFLSPQRIESAQGVYYETEPVTGELFISY